MDGKGVLYVADQGADAVDELSVNCASSSCVTFVGGGFGRADGVAVDGAGNVYVTDHQNKKVDLMAAGCASSACVTSLVSGFAGPSGIAVDGSDNVYVVDTYAPAVVKLDRADAPSFSFASTEVGATSSDSPRTVTVTNAGSAALSFPIPGSGNNPSISSGFVLSSSSGTACPVITAASAQAGSLAAGASCTLPISFAPTAAGADTGSLMLTDTNLNAAPGVTQTIGLSETATPYIPPSPASTLSVTAPTSVTGGTPFTFTVTAYDSQGNVATGYTGPVHLSSGDTHAILPVSPSLVQGTGSFSAILKTPGNQTIAASGTNQMNVSLIGMSGAIAVVIPNFVVKVPTDDVGHAANCTNQTTPGTGTDASCSLRDALLAAANVGSGNVTFDATVFAAATTITLTNGATVSNGSLGGGTTLNGSSADGSLIVPTYTTVQGPFAGTGGGVTNLLTIDGNHLVTVLVVGSGSSAVMINNLNIINGYSNQAFETDTYDYVYAGGIASLGDLATTQCTISGNVGETVAASGDFIRGQGGGVYNGGMMTITGSTISGNQSTNEGGGVYNGSAEFVASDESGGTLSIIGSTISANTGGADGGGVEDRDESTGYHPGTVAIAGSIVAGNLIGTSASDYGGKAYTDNGGNVVGGLMIGLETLGSYGGPTQRMVPLPSSPAICAGTTSAASTDQRGGSRSTTYPVNPTYPNDPAKTCIDSGSVQSNYQLTFFQQPSNVTAKTYMTPAPTVVLTESGQAYSGAGTTVSLLHWRRVRAPLQGTVLSPSPVRHSIPS